MREETNNQGASLDPTPPTLMMHSDLDSSEDKEKEKDREREKEKEKPTKILKAVKKSKVPQTFRAVVDSIARSNSQ